MRLFLILCKTVPVGSALLAQRLVGEMPVEEPIGPKPLRLFLRRRDGHLIADVDHHLPIGLIRPVSFDRARSPLIELDLLHRPIMHPSWAIPGQAAS